MKKTPNWTRFTIPFCLIVLGLLLNIYAFVKITNKGIHNPLPVLSSPATVPEPNLQPSTSLLTPIPSRNLESNALNVKQNFGHFRYAEGNPDEMLIIASYAQGEYQRIEKLDPEAGIALMQLIYAARDDNVWITPVSGFRSIEKQNKLFQAQVQKLGSVEAAAKISAPPGYSEHHTGYTIDLADGNFPKKDVTEAFENTDAFRWLTINASKFGFEMSFPKNNRQGVSYEPWHWRFVGSEDARIIFQLSLH